MVCPNSTNTAGNQNLNIKQKQFKTLKCLEINTDQLPNKLTELVFRANHLQADIICASEVIPKNQKEPLHKEIFEIPGFEMVHNLDKFGKIPNIRGCITYVRKGIKFKPVEIKSEGKIFEEAIFIEINLAQGDCLLCGNLYRRGESSPENNEALILTLLEIAKRKYSHAVLTGDINLKNIIWECMGTAFGYCANSDPSIFDNKFLECLKDCFFFQHVTENTRQRGCHAPSLLDLVITNEENLIDKLEYLEPLGKSDHTVLSFEIICEQESQPPVIKAQYEKGNYLKFEEEMNKINWEAELANFEGDVEGQWKYFRGRYSKIERGCIPRKKVFINGKFSKKLSTKYDQATVKKMKKKKKIWGRIRKNLASEEEQMQFKRIRNQIRRLTRKSKKIVEKNIAKLVKSNPKAFYKYSQSKLKTRSSIPDLIKPGTEKNPEYISDDKGKAEAYLEYFTSVFTEEPDSEEMPFFEERDYDSPLEDILINKDIVKEKLLKLKKNKSPGPDNMHPRVLSSIADSISSPLSIIFRTSLNTKVLPNEWKHANVSAIYKKDRKTLPSNYRPVSLTSVVCKVLESIIRDNIVKHMNDNQLFSQKQFGFLSKRSTVLQLIRVLDIWSEILDQGGSLDVIYMDFMKAFDKVPHRRLVYKVSKYGIKGKILDWISNFLTDRTQCVVINGVSSSIGNVTSGIPQGSVLGPLLFVIYINDLPDVVDAYTLVFLFVDDTKLFREIKSSADVLILQSDINKMSEWSKKWLLRFHPDKCVAMHLGNRDYVVSGLLYTPDGKIVEKSVYSMDDQTLNISKCEKDLGVHIDNNLNFERHIALATAKANRIMAIIYKTFDYIDEVMFKQLYKSLVRPHLEYAAPVWSPHNKILIGQLEGVQRRATKRVPGLSNLEYPDRLKKLNIPTLAYRRVRGDMIQMFKLHYGFHDKSLPDLFTPNTRASQGHNKKYKIKSSSNNTRKYNFSVKSIKLWNSLPQSVVDADSIESFEIGLDEFWDNQELKYDDFEAEIKIITNNRYNEFQV